MPNDRKMATTWLIPKEKEEKALHWLVQELLSDKEQQKQAIIICPFINPSSYGATENVAAVKESLTKIQKELKKIYQELKIDKKVQLKVEALHSKLEKTKQSKIIEEVYAKKIRLLVSTPMVEVGVDLPNADIIVIQSAERFGLSSLHQLRGRVGRRGQESYCLLFESGGGAAENQARLQKFCKEKDGLKLAQLDLENRGAGDILGYKQSGLNNLHFASWTNAEIINQAQERIKNDPNCHSFLQNYLEKIHSSETSGTIETATN
jgi:ATP-dependent DNA helicase RecG